MHGYLIFWGVPLSLIAATILFPDNKYVTNAGQILTVSLVCFDCLLILTASLMRLDEKTGKPANIKYETIRLATSLSTTKQAKDTAWLKIRRFMVLVMIFGLFTVGHRFMSLSLCFLWFMLFINKDAATRYMDALNPEEVTE